MPEYRHDLHDVLGAVKALQAQMRVFEVELFFDRPRPLTPVSAATFRGLLGWVLAQDAPELVSSFFKPGSGDSSPAAFALKQLDPACRETTAAAFRLVTFCASATIPAQVAAALTHAAPGRLFGDRETVVTRVHATRPLAVNIPFSDDNRGLFTAAITFRSPLGLKRHGRLVGPHEMSLAFLISGILERLGQLAQQYAAYPAISTAPAVATAALAFAKFKNLRWERWGRLSNAQDGQKLDMNGCMGTMCYEPLQPEIISLLAWGVLANVGRHASAGAGSIELAFEPVAPDTKAHMAKAPQGAMSTSAAPES